MSSDARYEGSEGRRLSREELYARFLAERRGPTSTDKPLGEISPEVFGNASKFYVHAVRRAARFEDERGADGVIVLSGDGDRLVCRKLVSGRYQIERLKPNADEYPHWKPTEDRETHPLHPRSTP